MPRPRPPFPAVSGLFGKPTIINNVETLANLPTVVAGGAERFSALGTKTSKGTKVFALSGKVSRTGLVEVAMGTPDPQDRLRHRRRHPQRQGLQGRADRRPLGRLHPHATPRHRRRLRVAQDGRRDHGLRRPGRHGRRHLHGRRGQVLHGLHPARELRQVHSLPRRHPPHAGNPAAHHAGPETRTRHRGPGTVQERAAPAKPGRNHPRHQPVRAGPDRAQSRAQHAALVPRRVRGAHLRAGLSGGRLRRAGHLLDRRREMPRLHAVREEMSGRRDRRRAPSRRTTSSSTSASAAAVAWTPAASTAGSMPESR